MKLLDRIAQGLDDLDARNLRRRLKVAETPCAPVVRVGERDMLAFCSNDYLGLASHPAIAAALKEGVDRYGVGSGASHLISGHSRAHANFEARVAQLYQPYIPYAGALLLSTGYLANLAVINGLARLGDDVEFFSEQLNHASIIDGLRMARRPMQVYAHGHVEQLDQMLAQSQAETRIIVTDSVFSMDGNLAPLAGLLELAERHDALLIVDDAHGYGVLGESGLGALEQLNLRSERLVYMGTLGKAAGVSGAFIVAHAHITEWLIQQARPYIYTTASVPALAHALLASLDIIHGDEGTALRQQLFDNKTALQNIVRLRQWSLPASQTAIQPVIIGPNDQALRCAAFLGQQGLWVPAIRPPTVPEGTARLRVTVSAAHSDSDVARLARALNQAEQELKHVRND